MTIQISAKGPATPDLGKKRIMGVDPSTYTGICTLLPFDNGLNASWTHVIHVEEKGLKRLQLIAEDFATTLDFADPGVVFIEGISFGSKGSSYVLLGPDPDHVPHGAVQTRAWSGMRFRLRR
jgi:hypothetical protein